MLAEWLVAAVVGALVVGVAADTLARARRGAYDVAARSDVRAQLQSAVTVIGGEVRNASGAAVGAPLGTDGDDPNGDLLAVADTALELRATIGTAVVCAVTPDAVGSVVQLPAAELASAPATAVPTAWWSTPVRAGDAVLVYDEGATASAADDRWLARTVRTVTDASGCTTGPFAAAVPGTRLALDAPALPATVVAGAPIRVLRRRRYSAYRAGDGLWYVGQREWSGTAWQGVQPVAGPIDTPARRGLALEAFDSAGASIVGVPSRAVVQLRFTVRATTAPPRAVTDTVRVLLRPADG